MGLLKELHPMPVIESDLIIIDEAGSVPAAVFKQPALPAMRVETDLVPKRDMHGFIESVSGFNAAGEKVTFTFERDGKKSLQRIKVQQ